MVLRIVIGGADAGVISGYFVIFGSVIALFGSISYAASTANGPTVPNRVTWVMWTVAPMVGFVAQVQDGVGIQALTTFTAGLGPAIILVVSFAARSGSWRIGPFDVACGSASAAAVGLWLAMGDPTLAVVLAVLADLVAGLPTIIKASRSPRTEHPTVYRNSMINAMLTVATISQWSTARWAFPVYLAILNGGLYVLVRLRGRSVHAC